MIKELSTEEKILYDLGLNGTEAKVYMAALELGSSTVLKIAKKAGVKRPTAYLTLDNLADKGFVAKVEKKSTTLYSAEKPSKILNKYKEKINNFKDLLPFYEAKYNKGDKPKIRYYEGWEQVWNVYLTTIFPSSELYFFGTDMKRIYEVFPDMIKIWSEKYASPDKEVMEIVSYNQDAIDYVKKYGKERQIRIMPKDLPVFSDSVIVKDKIFIVSLDHLFGVLIESEELAKTYKNFFKLAWRAALDYSDIDKQGDKKYNKCNEQPR
jgi:sugar-specific transcriptional regulator TrmB